MVIQAADPGVFRTVDANEVAGDRLDPQRLQQLHAPEPGQEEEWEAKPSKSLATALSKLLRPVGLSGKLDPKASEQSNVMQLQRRYDGAYRKEVCFVQIRPIGARKAIDNEAGVRIGGGYHVTKLASGKPQPRPPPTEDDGPSAFVRLDGGDGPTGTNFAGGMVPPSRSKYGGQYRFGSYTRGEARSPLGDRRQSPGRSGYERNLGWCDGTSSSRGASPLGTRAPSPGGDGLFRVMQNEVQSSTQQAAEISEALDSLYAALGVQSQHLAEHRKTGIKPEVFQTDCEVDGKWSIEFCHIVGDGLPGMRVIEKEKIVKEVEVRYRTALDGNVGPLNRRRNSTEGSRRGEQKEIGTQTDSDLPTPVQETPLSADELSEFTARTRATQTMTFTTHKVDTQPVGRPPKPLTRTFGVQTKECKVSSECTQTDPIKVHRKHHPVHALAPRHRAALSVETDRPVPRVRVGGGFEDLKAAASNAIATASSGAGGDAADRRLNTPGVNAKQPRSRTYEQYPEPTCRRQDTLVKVLAGARSIVRQAETRQPRPMPYLAANEASTALSDFMEAVRQTQDSLRDAASMRPQSAEPMTQGWYAQTDSSMARASPSESARAGSKGGLEVETVGVGT